MCIRDSAGLVREDREIMPRIVNGAVPTEVALMLPDVIFPRFGGHTGLSGHALLGLLGG